MTWAVDHLDVALHPSPDGLTDLTVFSEALGRRVDVTLYQVDSSDQRRDEMPVLVLLHGVYGSHWSWARSGRAHEVLRELVASGEVAPMIIAMPSDGMRGVGSGYIDRHGEDSESWIVDELRHVVSRVWQHASQEVVAVAGLSMGGWGALRLAGRHPGRFAAAAGMSPLTSMDQVAGYARPHRKLSHAAPWLAPRQLLDTLISSPSTLPPLRISCGTEDGLIESVRHLHVGLLANAVEHEYLEGPGGHNWTYWSDDLREVFRFVNACLPR